MDGLCPGTQSWHPILHPGFVALVAAGLRATAGGLRATATGLALVLLSRDDAEGSAAVGLLTGRGAC